MFTMVEAAARRRFDFCAVASAFYPSLSKTNAIKKIETPTSKLCPLQTPNSKLSKSKTGFLEL
jgi:hypothetical protein